MKTILIVKLQVKQINQKYPRFYLLLFPKKQQTKRRTKENLQVANKPKNNSLTLVKSKQK